MDRCHDPRERCGDCLQPRCPYVLTVDAGLICKSCYIARNEAAVRTADITGRSLLAEAMAMPAPDRSNVG